MRPWRLASWILALLGIAALGYCVAVYLGARLYQAAKMREFTHELRAPPGAKPGSAPAPASVSPPEGSLLGRMEVPRLRLSVMVVEGVDSGELRRAAGHIPGTALPGEPGNVAIAAHRDTFFRPLRLLHRGDIITLCTREGASQYRVTSLRVVSPEDIQVLYPTARDTLTLVTCFPFDYIGAAPRRFIVRAERVAQGKAVLRTGVRPTGRSRRRCGV